METLYERVGGQATIKNLINTFYKKVFTDHLIGPFFVHTSFDKLTQMQEQFFTIALGGPDPKNDIAVRQAHFGRGIEQQHLDRFTDHLLETLKEIGISENDTKDIVASISSYSDDILDN